MAYSEKFQALADAARSRVEEITPEQVDALVAAGAILLDIRDKEEHSLKDLEKRYIAILLDRFQGHRAKVAKVLKISERNLYRKLRTYQLAENTPSRRPRPDRGERSEQRRERPAEARGERPERAPSQERGVQRPVRAPRQERPCRMPIPAQPATEETPSLETKAPVDEVQGETREGRSRGRSRGRGRRGGEGRTEAPAVASETVAEILAEEAATSTVEETVSATALLVLRRGQAPVVDEEDVHARELA